MSQVPNPSSVSFSNSSGALLFIFSTMLMNPISSYASAGTSSGSGSHSRFLFENTKTTLLGGAGESVRDSCKSHNRSPFLHVHATISLCMRVPPFFLRWKNRPSLVIVNEPDQCFCSTNRISSFVAITMSISLLPPSSGSGILIPSSTSASPATARVNFIKRNSASLPDTT